MLEGLNHRFEAEQRGLKADRFQGNAGDVCELTFDVADIEAGVAHCLHSLRWNMRNHSRDEIESGASDVWRRPVEVSMYQ